MPIRDIIAIPGRGMAETNPFPALLVENLEDRGWLVCGNEPEKILKTRFLALIIHWPEHCSTVPNVTVVAWVRTFFFFTLITFLKLRGTRVIRIAHNVEEHIKRRKILRFINRKFSAWLTDHYIYLSESSMAEYVETYPAAKKCPQQLLFHPRYSDQLKHVESSQQGSRGRVVRFVGDIHDYKGLAEFLELLVTVQTRLEFEIIGRCKDHHLEGRINSSIAKAISSGHEVRWENRRPSSAELNRLMETSAVIVLPYLRGSNSGLLVSILEQRVPVLCSDLSLFREYSQALGAEWVSCFSPDAGDIENKLNLLMQRSPNEKDYDRLAAYLNALSWPKFVMELEKTFVSE